jgi:hypothetical protein
MSFADVIFIILVAGVIYGIVVWVGPASSEGKSKPDKGSDHQ